MGFERTCTTTFAGSNVVEGAIPIHAPPIVERLASRTDIAIVFGLISETLRTEEWAPPSVDTVTGPHIRGDVPIQQPLQELPVPIRRVSGDGLRSSSLPRGETCEHVLGGHRLLTHARRRRLHTHDHATVVIDQVVVVVTEPGGRAALGRIGGIGIGGRYLILLMHRLFHRVLLFHFPQILAHAVVHLGCLRQLLARNPTLLGGVCFHEAAIHRQVLALHQSHLHTLPHDLFEQLLEQFRLLKPSVPVLGERRVMRNLLIEPQPREPAPRQMHAQLFHQPSLTGDAVEITDQQNAQQKFRINRGPARFAVAVF